MRHVQLIITNVALQFKVMSQRPLGVLSSRSLFTRWVSRAVMNLLSLLAFGTPPAPDANNSIAC